MKRVVRGEDRMGNPTTAIVEDVVETPRPMTFEPYRVEVRGTSFLSTAVDRKRLIRVHLDGREERII